MIVKFEANQSRTEYMLNAIRKIDERSEILTKFLPMEASLQAKLDKKFRLEFNYNSNHLEGNTLTYGETELLLIFDETKGNHTLREYEEMKAHDVALQLIREWASDKERPLTETNIKNLNEVILARPFWKDAFTPDGQKTRRQIKIGDYKTFPNSVQLSNGEIFEYASVTDTPILMGEFLQWYREQEQKQDLGPVTLAAILHYKFVRIHPFDDGNGRISRLLMNYVLFRNYLPAAIIKSAEKRRYLSALNRADAGDLNFFVEYIAQQLAWSLELSIKAAKGKSIEDPDDLEKEISIWKKEALQNEVKTKQRNDFLIYELYTNGILDVMEHFENKHKIFYELFHKAEYAIYKNNGANGGIDSLPNGMKKIKFKSTIPSFLNTIGAAISISTEDTFRNIFIQTSLLQYKYNKKNPFSIHSAITINFHLYKYDVQYTNKRIEKMYGEFLNVEERNQIVDECIKAVFSEIKVKSGNGK